MHKCTISPQKLCSPLPHIFIDFEHYTKKRWKQLRKCVWGNHMNLSMLGITKVHKHKPDCQMTNIKHALKSKAVVQQNLVSDDCHSYDTHAQFGSSPSPLHQEWSALKHIIVNLFISTVWDRPSAFGDPYHLHELHPPTLLTLCTITTMVKCWIIHVWRFAIPFGLQSLGHRAQSMHLVYFQVYMCIKRVIMDCYIDHTLVKTSTVNIM